MTFAERMTEDRRLVVLLSLREATGYKLNETLLKLAIEHVGHPAGGRDQVRADMVWLEEHHLLRVEKITVASGELWVAWLTEAGEEVANGRYHPGVAKPKPR